MGRFRAWRYRTEVAEDFDDPTRCYPHTFSPELKQRLYYENAREFYGLE